MSVIINGDTGITTPAETITTNLTFTGTGNRITGDMSNTPHVNRVSFQSSVVDGSTSPFIIPNGTGTSASIVVANASDPTNCSYGQLAAVASTDVRIISSLLGTGTYLPLTFYTGGSERARIDTSGNVGIGTASPQSLLDLVGNDPTLRFTDTAGGSTATWSLRSNDANFSVRSVTAGNDRLVIDSTGNVGIGTSSPSFPLQVQTTAEWGIALKVANTSPTARALPLTQRALGTIASPLTVTNGTIIGGFDAGGYNGTAYTLGYNGGAGIQAIATETWTSISNASGLIFLTTPSGGANYAERMRIDSSGNVGIGTATTNPAGFGKGVNLDGTGTSGYQVSVGGTLTGYFSAYPSETRIGSISTNPMTFYTNSSERMRIDSSGNVGIGTASPTAKLDIVGGTLGTTAGSQIVLERLFSNSGNSDYLEITNTRQIAGSNWFGAGHRLQEKIDFTYMGYIQFNGANDQGISFGTGSSLVSATSVPEQMRIDSAGLLKFNSGYGSAATAYGCRAWVNFNGTGTVAIRASGNVSSITDNGTGDYTVNFTTALVDGNYAAVFGGGRDTNPTNGVGPCAFFAGTTTTQRLLTADSNFVATDYVRAMVSIFR